MAALIGGMLVYAVRAADIYVAPDGDDASPGSRTQPLRTLRAAAQAAQPGDTCIVRRGFYRETLRPARSGKFGKPIRFVAAPGETVTIAQSVPQEGWQVHNGAVYKTAASNILQLLVDGVPAAALAEMPKPAFEPQAVWWTAHDGSIYARFPNNDGPAARRVETQRDPWSADLSGLSHVVVKGFGMVAGSINLSNANHCQVEDCHLWWPAEPIQAGGDDNEINACSLLGCARGGVVCLAGSTGNRIINTLLRGGDRVESNAVGIVAGGTATTVRGVTAANWPGGTLLCSNLLNGRVTYCDLRDSDHGASGGAVLKIVGDGKGTILSHNWVQGSRSRNGDGIRLESSAENYVIHHNVVWGHDRAAIRLSGACRYVFLCNNTCLASGAAIDAVELPAEAPLKGAQIINNLFEGMAWPSSGGLPPAGVVSERNYTGPAPGLTDPATRNFQPGPGSPCLDAGMAEPDFTEGYSGAGPDIGAVEAGVDSWTPGCATHEAANQVAKPVMRLSLDCMTPGAEIRYTMDGRLPDSTSTIYTGPVTVVNGSIRVKAFLKGMEESPETSVTIHPPE